MVSKPRSVQSSRWDGAIFLIIPGTSCLATIVLSLRDKIHSTAEALLKLAQKSRPVGYGLMRAGVRTVSMKRQQGYGVFSVGISQVRSIPSSSSSNIIEHQPFKKGI